MKDNNSSTYWTGQIIGVIVSLFIHVGAGLGAFFARDIMSSGYSKDSSSFPKFIVARLVRLGVPPDPKKLPPKLVAPKPQTPKKIIEVTKAKKETTKLAKREKKANPIQSQATTVKKKKRLEDVFKEARMFEEVDALSPLPGHPEGIKGGEIIDPQLASQGNLYATKIYQLFKERWAIPLTIPQDKLSRLRCEVKIKLGPSLEIQRYEIETPSLDPVFDASVLEAIQRVKEEIGSLPPAPKGIQEWLKKGGLLLGFNGKDMME